jgi:hypothetical protein
MYNYRPQLNSMFCAAAHFFVEISGAAVPAAWRKGRGARCARRGCLAWSLLVIRHKKIMGEGAD